MEAAGRTHPFIRYEDGSGRGGCDGRGGAPTTAMTHIAIQEYLDGKVVEWMEKVSDEQYRG